MYFASFERYNCTTNRYAEEKPFGVYENIQAIVKAIKERHKELPKHSEYEYLAYKIRENGRIKRLDSFTVAEITQRKMEFFEEN